MLGSDNASLSPAHLVFGRRLRAADKQVLVTLCGDDNGSIGLQIKVLLPTHLDGPLNDLVSSCDCEQWKHTCQEQAKDKFRWNMVALTSMCQSPPPLQQLQQNTKQWGICTPYWPQVTGINYKHHQCHALAQATVVYYIFGIVEQPKSPRTCEACLEVSRHQRVPVVLLVVTVSCDGVLNADDGGQVLVHHLDSLGCAARQWFRLRDDHTDHLRKREAQRASM